jgi:hypothetical protein
MFFSFDSNLATSAADFSAWQRLRQNHPSARIEIVQITDYSQHLSEMITSSSP